MKLTSILIGSLMLAFPAFAFEQSTIQTLRVATAAAGVYHSKFPQAVKEGPEAAISNINSATARAADEAMVVLNGLKVQSRNFFNAMTTLSHDSTNPVVFCSKNIDRLGPTMGWNLRLVRYGIEPYAATLKRDCEDGEKLVTGLAGGYKIAVDSLEQAQATLESPKGRCKK
ncbi:hypothetical protein MGYG_04562 [Nannizzia gypsea CBS 118893]|uniref:Uncharacterized protein n=1 Tax=Arthroderma gypseum (strain ATCC MYA-4604 / CBS 118893) TaxID=535722 RepID=E4UTR7_ARTGP|nr:hypothetical protein MGYG_04562 [Nannizzia gypsea CBS 118893]EFR01560.1 hypothetical protein MGYG_04562 [Nannizzia gypsea CBS 118893]